MSLPNLPALIEVSSVFTASDLTSLCNYSGLVRAGNIVNKYKFYWPRGIISLVESAAKTIVRLTESNDLSGKWRSSLKAIRG